MKNSWHHADLVRLVCAAILMLTALAAAHAAPASSATRTLPASYTPQVPLPVKILAVPASNITSWTLVETLPAGWSAGSINQNGVWDAQNSQVKWGPFLDATSITLTYTATPPASATGAQTIAGTATFNSKPQTVSGGNKLAFDTNPPLVASITRLDANPTSLSTVRFQVVFSEPVTSVSLAQFSLSRGGTLGGATLTALADGPTTWTVTANTKSGSGSLRLDVSSNGYSGIKDYAGNYLGLAYSSGQPYTIDRGMPAGILNTNVATATNQTTIPVTVTFNEPVRGFDASDLITTNALVANFGTSTTALYHFNLIPLSEGTVAVGFGEGAALDAAGNSNSASRLNLVYDKTGPAFTVSGITPFQASVNTQVMISFTASEPLVGAPEVKVNGHLAYPQNNTDLVYTYVYTVFGGDPDGPAQIDISGTDGAGNSGASSISTVLVVDLKSPTGSVKINGGAAYSTSTAVMLNLSASDQGGTGVTAVNVSNDGTSWNGWTPMAAALPWTLTAGDGLKTAYVQFQDAVGNISDVTTDTIMLDSVRPYFNNFMTTPALALTQGQAVTTTMTASETLQSSPTLQINGHYATLRNHRGSQYGFSYNVAASDPDGAATVVAAGRDQAGNRGATTTTALLTIDKTAPSGTVVINNGAAFATSTTVYLSISASDGKGTGVTKMSLSGDGAAWTPWEKYAAYRVYALGGADGVKFVYIRFQDAAGHVSAPVKGTILLDIHAPQSQVTTPSGDFKNTLLPLGWSVTDASAGSALKSVEIFWSKDGGAWASLGTFAPGVTSTTFDTKAHGGSGTYLFFSVAKDLAGNVEPWPASTDTMIRVMPPNASSVVLYLLGYTTSTTGLDYSKDGKITITDELCRQKLGK